MGAEDGTVVSVVVVVMMWSSLSVCVSGVQCKDSTTVMGAEDGTVVSVVVVVMM